MNVTAIKESDWNKDGTIVHVTEVTLEDGRKAPGYDLPSVPEIGKPLPDGWEFATGKSGKPYIKVPKGKSQTPAAYRNTKEGFHEEQASIHRSVAVQLALKHASELQSLKGKDVLILADEIYAWLRHSSLPDVAAATTGGSPVIKGDVGETKRQQAGPTTARVEPMPLPSSAEAMGGAGKAGVEGAAAPTPRRDRLWSNLVDYAGSKKKAVTLVNLVCKSNWTEPHAADITEEDLLATIKQYALLEEPTP